MEPKEQKKTEEEKELDFDKAVESWRHMKQRVINQKVNTVTELLDLKFLHFSELLLSLTLFK